MADEKVKTKTVTLSEPAIFGGKVYGPGPGVEVPEEFPDDTEARIVAKRERRELNPQSPPGASGSGVPQTGDVVSAQGTLLPRDPATGAMQQRENPLTGEGGGAGNGGSQPVNWERKDKDELLAEAERRKLTVKGTGTEGNILKTDLVEALEKDDKSKAGGK